MGSSLRSGVPEGRGEMQVSYLRAWQLQGYPLISGDRLRGSPGGSLVREEDRRLPLHGVEE